MKKTALILAALLFGLAYGLMPTGSPLLEAGQGVTLFGHTIRVHVHLSIEEVARPATPDTLIVASADSSFGSGGR